MKLKNKFIRYRLMERHTELVKAGELDVARLVLRFLIKKEIRLGLDDASWMTESELEKAGVFIRYDRRGYTSYARL